MYKIDKVEDNLRRRFHLKKDKKWSEKGYMRNFKKFHKNP